MFQICFREIDSVGDLPTKEYVNENLNDLPTTNDVNEKVRNCISKSGDQMTGNLNIRGNSITRLADPENHINAVHKSYIDT